MIEPSEPISKKQQRKRSFIDNLFKRLNASVEHNQALEAEVERLAEALKVLGAEPLQQHSRKEYINGVLAACQNWNAAWKERWARHQSEPLPPRPHKPEEA